MTKRIPFFIVLIFSLLCLMMTFLSPSAFADISMANNTTIEITDGNITWDIEGKTRNNNQSIVPEKVDGSEILNGFENVDYYYTYNWSVLKYLNIKITPNYTSSNITVSSTDLYVSYIGTSNTSQQTENTALVYSSTKNSVLNFNYYIDTDAGDYSGYGFGLYRFELQFTYTSTDSSAVEQVNEGPFTQSAGVIYLAILPDYAENLGATSFDVIIESTESSNEFLNVYNLALNTYEFDYIDPAYIIWTVSGEDLNHRSYVLTESDRIASNDENSLILWETYNFDDRSGHTFRFDSHNIEGTFTVTATVYASDGSAYASGSITVSTVKESSLDLTWLWILLSVGGVGIISIVIMIIVIQRKKKKEA